MEKKLPAYGGQALIEGVVMRGMYTVAAAMRDPDNKLVIQTEDLLGMHSSRLRKIPFFRGLLILWDSLGLGYKYLTISANLQVKNDEEKLGTGGFIATFILSLSIAILFFMVLPATVAGWLEQIMGWNPIVTNLLEGIFRLLVLILYLVGIGQMDEIKRVFGYHGAEHKTINAYEAGVQMIPESVMKCSIEHPRCGTSFLLTLVIFSIIIFTLIGPLSLPTRILSRILLIPFIASISYEYIRWTADNLDNFFIRLLIRPNLALQRLTTREPNIEMVETAISAFNAMLIGEQSHELSSK